MCLKVSLCCVSPIYLSSFLFDSGRLRQKLHFVHWNEEGWKTGLCSVPPVGQVSACTKQWRIRARA